MRIALKTGMLFSRHVFTSFCARVSYFVGVYYFAELFIDIETAVAAQQFSLTQSTVRLTS